MASHFIFLFDKNLSKLSMFSFTNSKCPLIEPLCNGAHVAVKPTVALSEKEHPPWLLFFGVRKGGAGFFQSLREMMIQE